MVEKTRTEQKEERRRPYKAPTIEAREIATTVLGPVGSSIDDRGLNAEFDDTGV